MVSGCTQSHWPGSREPAAFEAPTSAGCAHVVVSHHRRRHPTRGRVGRFISRGMAPAIGEDKPL
jgi:hypothetical protein